MVQAMERARLSSMAGVELRLASAGVEAGEAFGLYRAMSAAGPVTAGEFASLTGLPESGLQVWLHAQAADGYVTQDINGRFANYCELPSN